MGHISKDLILQILDKWNFWSKKIDSGVQRDYYLKKILKYLPSPEVVALTGIRRSGKSTLLLQTISHLLAKGIPKENILYLNFEEPMFEVYASLSFLQEVYKVYLEHFNPKGRIYLFLDEVQVAKKWERFVVSLYDRKDPVKIFVTGSSVKFLQDDISTLLSGRYFSEIINPLNFAEILDFKKVKYQGIVTTEISHLLLEYLNYGGFPRVVLEEEKEQKIKLLQEYYNTIVERDIILRHKLKNDRGVKELLLYVFGNIGNLLSNNTLEKTLGLPAENIRRYLGFFEEAFLLSPVNFFSYKITRQVRQPKKIYCMDTGLVNAVGFRFSENRGRLLENIIYNHLRQNGKQVFYWKNEKTEIDFVTRQGYQTDEIFNISWDVKDKKTRSREETSLREGRKKLTVKKATLISFSEAPLFLLENT